MSFAIDLVSGFRGDPRPPNAKRWYACRIRNMEWACHMIENKHLYPQCTTIDIPTYLPEFLDRYVIQYKFNDRIPVSIHSKSPETSAPKPPTPSEQRPVSPSVRQIPFAMYKDVRTQPKNPFQ